MSEIIKFSICIPNYNYADYIIDTIQSVLDQTYQNFEILIADNASTDDSVENIKAIDDSRIQLFINNYNVGFAPNLDKAAQHAIGDYMIMLSSDDRMKPNALEKYAELIEEYKGEKQDLVISSSCDIINENNEITGHRHAMNRQLIDGLKSQKLYHEDDIVKKIKGFELLKCVMNGSLIAIGRFVSTCYSRNLYNQVEGYNSIMSVMPDAHFSHKIMWQNPTVIFTDEILFQYRVHTTNNYAAIFNSIKLLADGYQLTQMYSENDLHKIELTKSKLQKNYVSYNLKGALSRLISGQNLYFFRLNAFLWSAYPKYMVSQYLAWAFPILCLSMPVFYIIKKFRNK